MAELDTPEIVRATLRLRRPGPATRRTVRVAIVSAAATLLALLVVCALWWARAQWRLGRVVLTNDTEPLTAQVLSASGDQPIGEPIELLGRATLALPDGDYRLRLTGAGRISRTYPIAVNRGETNLIPVSLDGGRLLGQPGTGGMLNSSNPAWPAIPFTAGTTAVELTPGKFDLIEQAGGRLRRRDGTTGQIVWDALEPVQPGKPPRSYHPWLLRFAERFQWAPSALPAADFDRDGTNDLLWTSAHSAGLLALSGKDGSVLWTYLPELDGPGDASPEGPDRPGPINPALRPVYIIDRPGFANVDRDAVPDLLVTLQFHEFPSEIERRIGAAPGSGLNQPNWVRRVVLAVSGATGALLWRHDVDPAFTQMKGRFPRRAVPVAGRQTSIAGLVTGNIWTGLDLAAGRPVSGPIDLGFEPETPPRHVDLNGDGEPELLAVGPGAGGGGPMISAYSIATGRPLWTASGGETFATPFGMATSPSWPVPLDLEGDGRPELVMPDAGALDPANKYRGIRVLDGATGKSRWLRPMRPATIGADGLLDAALAPDLDADGVRDLIAVSVFLSRHPINANQGGPTAPERIYAEAISGKSGRPLWFWHVEIPTDLSTTVARPLWWGRGPDGWPLLAIPINAAQGGPTNSGSWSPSNPHPSMVYMLEASTGREVASLRGWGEVHAADLDGDGIDDLWGEFRGELRAYRGEGPELWRTPTTFQPARRSGLSPARLQPPAADLDGDGVGDVLPAILEAPGDMPSRSMGSRTAIARSGRDGRLIWKSRVDVRRGWFDGNVSEGYLLSLLPAPAGDLDGDGVADVLVIEQNQLPPIQVKRGPATLPLMLLSGRTGQPVWTAGPLPFAFETHGYSGVNSFQPVVVEPGGSPDLLVRHNSQFLSGSPTAPLPGAPWEERLARVSGRTGRVIWDVPIFGRPRGSGFSAIGPMEDLPDLDGDGSADAIVLVPANVDGATPDFQLQALSLRDGRAIWSVPFSTAMPNSPQIRVRDPDSDGRRALVAMYGQPVGKHFEVVVQSFDGHDGHVRWTWSADEGPALQVFFEFVATPARAGSPGWICVAHCDAGGLGRIVVLDDAGHERARRSFPAYCFIRGINGDGEGRDGLLVWHPGTLRGIGPDLQDRWSRPVMEPTMPTLFVPKGGQTAATVVLNSGLGLDARTGLPRWRGHTDLPGEIAALTDVGDPDGLPLLVKYRGGETILHRAMPARPDGSYAPPHGTPVPPGYPREDPRWTRLLPWVEPVAYRLGPRGIAVCALLAFVNVVVPLACLRLVLRRRTWNLRALMALPLAAAVPLTIFQQVEPIVPAELGGIPIDPRLVFAGATVAGIPIVAYLGWIGWSLLRLRWRRIILIAALSIASSALVAAAWLRYDSRSMPAIEHYGRSDWPLVFVPGLYATGLFLLIGWPLWRTYQWMRRPRTSGAP